MLDFRGVPIQIYKEKGFQLAFGMGKYSNVTVDGTDPQRRRAAQNRTHEKHRNFQAKIMMKIFKMMAISQAKRKFIDVSSCNAWHMLFACFLFILWVAIVDAVRY